MQLFTILLQYYLLVVVVVSDIKVMSSTVAVIFAVINYLAITLVANTLNYNIRTEQIFFELSRTKLSPNRIRVFFKNRTETESK